MPPSDSLNEVAFSGRFLEVIGSVSGARKGDLCQVHCPNDYLEKENDGFIILNLTRGDYYEIIDELTEEMREIGTDFEFFILEWKDFGRYFRLLDDRDRRVMEYKRRKAVGERLR